MSEVTERPSGWYWLKNSQRFVDMGAPSGWVAHYWNGDRWEDDHHYWHDDFFSVIGPRIPTPDEPWQCVPKEATPDMLDVQTLGYHTPASKRWRETLAAAPKP